MSKGAMAGARVDSPKEGPTGASETDSVDRIREILFGTQNREYAQRLQQMEERFLREIGELKAEVRRHLEAIESHAQLETRALADRLCAERDERSEASERISKDLTESVNLLTKRLHQSEEQVSKELREFRQAEMERHNSLSDELMKSIAAAGLLQGQRLDELRASTVGRMALADFLAELALEVRGESDLSGHGAHSADKTGE